MKFNAYFVELEHPEPTLTSNVMISGESVSVNFTRVDPNIFVAHFANQVELCYLQSVEFKNKDLRMKVLLPVISKYNKRRLTKLSGFLGEEANRDIFAIMSFLPSVDKFLRMEELLDFFNVAYEDVRNFLIRQEVEKKLKVVNLMQLCSTTYAHYLEHLEQLENLFTESCTGKNQVQVLKFADIEETIKIPHVSIFFKYLVRLTAAKYSLKIRNDRVIFKKTAQTQEGGESAGAFEDILKKNKLIVFTIESILKLSGLSQKEVNDTLWFLVENGEVMKLNERFFIFTEEYDRIINRMKKYMRTNGEMIDIQSFRELTTLTRKYIIPLLEYMDLERVTERVDNERRILIQS